MEIELALEEVIRDRLQPRNLQPMYKAWANKLEAETVKAFKAERTPYTNEPWAELSPQYKRYKERGKHRFKPKRGGKKKLQWTGSLYDSIYASVGADGVTVGSNLRVGTYSLGAIHNFGAPRRSIPARPFLPMDAEGQPLPGLIEDLQEIALDVLNETP